MPSNSKGFLEETFFARNNIHPFRCRRCHTRFFARRSKDGFGTAFEAPQRFILAAMILLFCVALGMGGLLLQAKKKSDGLKVQTAPAEKPPPEKPLPDAPDANKQRQAFFDNFQQTPTSPPAPQPSQNPGNKNP